MESQELLNYGFFAGIITMAIIHGLLLSGIFLFHQRLRSKANRFLALSIFGICIVLFYEATDWLGIQDWIPLWFQYLPVYLRTTIPVGLFYFVLYFIRADHPLKRIERLGYYMLGLDVILELCHIPINHFISDATSIDQYETYLFYIQSLLSILAAFVLLPQALRRVNVYQLFLYEHYSSDDKRNLSWLRYFLIALLACAGMWVVAFMQYYLGYDEAALWTFSILTIGMVMTLFWIGYFLILQNNWFELVAVDTQQPSSENKLSAKTDTYHQELMTLMSVNKLYENFDLTLDQLAEQLSISSRYLSQIIKEKEGKNLFEFVNHYRVEAVKKKLMDQQYDHLTLMGIAMESGFNSRSTFHSVFKKFTGQTPSAFKKQHLVD